MAIAAVAGLAAGIGAAAAGAAFFGATGFLAFAGYFAVGAGLSAVSRALAPKPNLGVSMRGLTRTVRSPAGSRKIIYGKIRVGGQVVFIENSGTDNEFLHLVIAFATHEIESFEEIYYNDKLIWQGGSYHGGGGVYNTITTFDGTQTQADSTLVAVSDDWTNDHVLNGIAYAHFKLEFNDTYFPQGIPNISAVIKGKKVYDPRKDSTSSVYDSGLGVSTHRSNDSTTWEYSQNPALCVRDYLVDAKYGLGEDHDLIDSIALGAAADLSDELIADASKKQAANTILNGTLYEIVEVGTFDYTAVGASSNTVGVRFTASNVGSVSGTGFVTRFFVKKYEANGVVDTANNIKDNIEQLLSAMGGKLTYSSGKYFIDGAEYKTPTVTFTEADCITDIQTQTRQSRRNIYNGVKGIFVSEEKNYKVMDYPAQISSTYAIEDGDPIFLDMPLPFVTNNIQAQRLAKIALLKSRQQVVINMAVNLKGLQVKVGDTIKVTNERLGYSEKVFDVIDYGLAINGEGSLGVNLQCIETAPAVYDWTTDDQEDFLSGGELDLYDGTTVDDVTFTASDISEIGLLGPDGQISTNVELTWTPPDDAFIDFYKVRYNKNGSTDYFHAETREPRILLSNIDVTSNYDFRIQVQNFLGVTSSGVTVSNQLLEGDTTAPDPVTDVNIETGLKYSATVTWTNPTNPDLAFVQIYVDALGVTKPADPIAKINGTEFVYVPRSKSEYATVKYFWLEAVDFSGNVSTTVGPVQEEILLPRADEVDGDVGEALTFGLYNSSNTTLGTSDVTFGEFEVPAPDQGIIKYGTLLAHGGIVTTGSTASFTVKIDVERKSKGATSGNLIGTIVASGGIAAGAAYADIAGNHMKEIDLFGGIATTQTSPSAVYNVTSVQYDQTNDRTRIVYAKFGAITSGDLYYNADRWTSSGTWLNYSAQEARYAYPDYSGLMTFMLFQPLAKTNASQTYRIRARHHGFSGTSVQMTQGIVGQIQLLS